MTDKEIKTEFIHLQGKLFAIMQALAILIEKETPVSSGEFLKHMNDVADTQSTILLNVLEARDLGGKTE